MGLPTYEVADAFEQRVLVSAGRTTYGRSDLHGNNELEDSVALAYGMGLRQCMKIVDSKRDSGHGEPFVHIAK